MRLLNSACIGFLGIGLIVLAGCGGGKKSKSETVPVSGTVMYKGNPIEGVKVTFMSVDASRAATGVTDSQGKFQLSTFGANDGAVVGTHAITVMKPVSGAAADTQPTPAGGDPAELTKMYRETSKQKTKEKSPIPEKYANAKTSGLKETVTDGGPNTFILQLTD